MNKITEEKFGSKIKTKHEFFWGDFAASFLLCKGWKASYTLLLIQFILHKHTVQLPHCKNQKSIYLTIDIDIVFSPFK